MTDASLRELERRWIEGGDLEAEARYLSAALRAGELEPGRLTLASYLGHEPATLALGAEAPASPDDPIPWALGLQPRGGVTALRRVALAAAAAAIRAAPDGENGLGRVWRTVRRFVLCPCGPHRLHTFDHRAVVGTFPEEGWDVLRLALLQVDVPWRCVDALAGALAWPGPALCDAAQVRAAIQEQVVPWALGRADPLQAGWATPLSELTPQALLALVEDLRRRHTGFHQVEVLDPELFRYAWELTPAQTVARALAFVPAASDTPELLAALASWTVPERTRDGLCAEFEPFFQGGWREVYGTPYDPPPVPAFDFQF
ncbi:MAG: hypothetical protein AB7N76_12370 [Planctomycetota bacterium]